MKKCTVIVFILLMLSGCSQPKTYETVMDSQVTQVQPEKLEILVELPPEAAQPAMTSDTGEILYLCGDYTLSLQTVEGGDLQKTVLSVCGFPQDQLPVVDTVQGNAKRYAFVWTAAGETGQQVGRCAILDDGSYHYILTAMADATVSGNLADEVWKGIFNSFRIVPAEEVVSSGS